jgi:hypothetical protein
MQEWMKYLLYLEAVPTALVVAATAAAAAAAAATAFFFLASYSLPDAIEPFNSR